jgi:hypothetical protein
MWVLLTSKEQELAQNLRFCFALDPIGDIEPWIEPARNEPSDSLDTDPGAPRLVINPSHPLGGRSVEGRRFLSWFGLTLGHYWISTPLGEVLRYSDESVEHWNLPSPYVGYQVGRLFLDLQEVFPLSLEPVPSDIAAVVSDPAWYERSEEWSKGDEDGDDDWRSRCELWYDALEWWHNREVDTSYLTSGLFFRIWRVEEDVFFRWRCSEKDKEAEWCLPAGEIKMNVEDYASSCYSFFNGFIKAMRERVQAIESEGWHRTECHLDASMVAQEQRNMEASVNSLKDRRTATDWGQIRNRLDLLRSRLQ